MDSELERRHGDAEAARQQHEVERQAAERARITAEKSRVSAEDRRRAVAHEVSATVAALTRLLNRWRLSKRSDGTPRRMHCRGQEWSTTLSSVGLIVIPPPLYSIKPSFRNLFIKKLTRLRVVPTISASASCDSLGTTR